MLVTSPHVKTEKYPLLENKVGVFSRGYMLLSQISQESVSTYQNFALLC